MLNADRLLTPSWEFVQPSIRLVIKNYEAIIFIELLPTLLTAFGALIISSNHSLGLVAIIVGVAWRVINMPISYYLQLKAAQGKVPSLGECYSRGLPFWPRIIAFEILFSIMLLIGVILLIIPALIVFRRYFLTPYYIVSKNLPIGAAMDASANQTRPVSAFVWGTIGVMLAFTVLASLASSVSFIGPILAALISLIYFFGPVLRWQEVSRAGKK